MTRVDVPGPFLAWDEEFSTLMHIAWPSCISGVLNTVLNTVDTACLGAFLGPTALAASSSANIFVTFTFIVPLNLLSVVPMLCSQALGAGNLQLFGEHFQRASIIYTAIAIPVLMCFFFCEPALAVVGVPAEQASAAGEFACWIIPATYLSGLYRGVRQYYESLGSTLPALIVDTIAVFMNLALNVVFIPLLGLKGSPIATAISLTIQTLLLLAICYRQQYAAEKGVWFPILNKWDIHSACNPHRVKEFLAISLPAAFTNLLSQGSSQVVSLFVARLGPVPMAAYGAAMSVMVPCLGLGIGMLVAAMVRIGFLLGAGKPRCAKQCLWRSYFVAFVLTLPISAGLQFGRFQVAKLFSKDEEFVELTAELLGEIAWLVMFFGGALVGMGGMIATNRVRLNSYINAVCGWLFNIPCAYFLGIASWNFAPHLGAAGVLASSTLNYTLCAFVAFLVLYSSDWAASSDVARERADAHKLPSEEAEEVAAASSGNAAVAPLLTRSLSDASSVSPLAQAFALRAFSSNHSSPLGAFASGGGGTPLRRQISVDQPANEAAAAEMALHQLVEAEEFVAAARSAPRGSPGAGAAGPGLF
eukprot:TRINITY_DN24375_c0_g1_i1.p1 TRINITY_DN24375_c0_g1~~TRINITY_DN24375_c0_g1_i1.p1  ORF type:complete len:599 (+),score=74.23 TRINITY_DN24375_c0_g1_i1:34-1797(+)